MGVPGCVVPGVQRVFVEIEKPGARLQFGIVTARQPLMVPGTDLLADVAAGDPRAKGISDLSRELSFSIFNGVKSDASAGIDDERFGDGICRTGIHAGFAATAETSGRFIGFEIQGG